jgi:hypothetical protein
VSGVAAPEPRVLVTVLGLSPDDVRVVDARRSGSDVDVVRIELGDVHLAGDLRTMQRVVSRVLDGLADVVTARTF